MKTQRVYWQAFAVVAVLSSALAAFAFAHAQTVGARTTIGSQLQLGSTGDDVKTLQTYLATNTKIYPEGIVSGYYGPLTETAVAQFQIASGLPPVGNVGPQTLAKLNSLLVAGASLDVSAPFISNVRIATTTESATISWTTSEPTLGSVHYDFSPIAMKEVSVARVDPQTSGTLVTDSTLSSNHSITLHGLGTAVDHYYFSIESKDVAGNISVTFSMPFTLR